ncbi:MAG: hypothetical protein HQ558_03180 [Candidatus Omnitrophica bacterium]|nr:hypothetical protein [Candidatus Omnitrophota bacterium]
MKQTYKIISTILCLTIIHNSIATDVYALRPIAQKNATSPGAPLSELPAGLKPSGSGLTLERVILLDPTGFTPEPRHSRILDRLISQSTLAERRKFPVMFNGDLVFFEQLFAENGRLLRVVDKKPQDIELIKIDGRQALITSGLYPCSALIYLIRSSEGLYVYPLHVYFSDIPVLKLSTLYPVNQMILTQAQKDLGTITDISLIFIPGIIYNSDRAQEMSKFTLALLKEQLSQMDIPAKTRLYQCMVSYENALRGRNRSVVVDIDEEGAEVSVLDYKVLKSSEVRARTFFIPVEAAAKAASSGKDRAGSQGDTSQHKFRPISTVSLAIASAA